ncbi:MAG TPA: hypothetical protein VLD58_13080 [Gemmatimonadales bacterium]|nr:hypothetical protein [Gemmatimonadales bacterium]
MRIRDSLLLLATLTAVACGGDGGTSPTGPANVAGTWSFEAHGLTTAGSDVKCGITGSLQMAQEGTLVSGSYIIDRITCTSPAGTEVLPGPWGGSIVNGTVEGNTVHFHFDTDDVDQHGTVSGNRISGTCTWRYEVDGGGYLTLTGNWSATRT